ncbi:MAG: ATP-binding cassette domain-containing protein [Burkholderiales bacterium]|nr:ATP-binding cassette domain-containing protein [Burkholderiales bacterium]
MVETADTDKPIIEVKNLGTYFSGLWVHKDLNLTIYPNRVITIIGASGCGKTTLVREILMLQSITEGEILLGGEEISQYNIDDANTKLLLSQVGMMFQQGALFSSMTIIENVMFPLQEYTDFSKSTIVEMAILKLKLTGLAESAYFKYPKEISPGMQKRVALARTLALDPKVIFLDEPTAGLDPNSASDFDVLISTLQQQLRLTIIMITHDLDSIWSISDEIVYLGEKRVLFHNTVAKAAECKEIPELYNYFNGPRGKLARMARGE